jgi:hypothetical protein
MSSGAANSVSRQIGAKPAATSSALCWRNGTPSVASGSSPSLPASCWRRRRSGTSSAHSNRVGPPAARSRARRAAQSCCARPLHAKRRRRGLTGGRRPLSDTRRAHWRFLAAATSTGCSAKRRPAQRCLRGTAPENMRVCRVRGRAESAITSQWHLPRQGPGRRRCRGSVGTLDILLQPIALEGAIDQDHDCSFVFGDTGIVRGAERTSRDAAHEQRCGRGFEIEGEYAAHLSLSSGVSAAPAACEGRPGLRAR